MDKDTHALELLWDRLLSRNSKLIRSAYDKLDPSDQAAVLAHLERMVTEPGWQPEQRDSAASALKAIKKSG